MNEKFSAFIFRTRGIYMFIALAISAAIKYTTGGRTPLPFFLVGLGVMVIVQLLRMYAASFLWGRQAVRKIEADFLCVVGPYAYVRNPLYLGNLFIGIGLAITLNEWYTYALFILSYAFVYSIVIPYEERFLTKKFDKYYLDYTSRVKRLIPTFSPYKSESRVVPDFRAGILGEIHVPILLTILSFIIYLFFVR